VVKFLLGVFLTLIIVIVIVVVFPKGCGGDPGGGDNGSEDTTMSTPSNHVELPSSSEIKFFIKKNQIIYNGEEVTLKKIVDLAKSKNIQTVYYVDENAKTKKVVDTIAFLRKSSITLIESN